MLIEHIIEFEVRKHGLRKCTPTAGYFYDRRKIEGISSSGLFYYFLLKYCWRQYSVLPPTWAKSLTNLIPNSRVKRVLDLNCT